MEKELTKEQREEKEVVKKLKQRTWLSFFLFISMTLYTVSQIKAAFLDPNTSGLFFLFLFFEFILVLGSGALFWGVSFSFILQKRHYDYKYNGLKITGKF